MDDSDADDYIDVAELLDEAFEFGPLLAFLSKALQFAYGIAEDAPSSSFVLEHASKFLAQERLSGACLRVDGRSGWAAS